MASTTATGISQLSYCAARKRNTRTNASAKSSGAWLPAAICWKVVPVHSNPIDGGSRRAARVSIACRASPALNPGAGEPVIVADGNRL